MTRRNTNGMKWKRCPKCGLRIYPNRPHVCMVKDVKIEPTKVKEVEYVIYTDGSWEFSNYKDNVFMEGKKEVTSYSP